jgi:hypothetical protein
MIELGKCIGFAVEILNCPCAFFGIGKAVENLFYCTVPLSQALIVSNIDESHATTGEETLDTVSSREQRSRLELSTLIARHGRYTSLLVKYHHG